MKYGKQQETMYSPLTDALSPRQAHLFENLPSQFSAKKLVEHGRRLYMRGLEVENALQAYQRKGLIRGSAMSGYQKVRRAQPPLHFRHDQHRWVSG